MLNLIMLAVQAAPRGGTVTIRRETLDDSVEFKFESEGPKVRLNAAIERALSGKSPEDGFDGRSIQPFYTTMLTREAGGTVSAHADEGIVVFNARFPQSN